jgi:hypothetical protein
MQIMKTEKKAPEPLEDLTAEYEEEDREIEGRTPDLAETEEDPSEN